MADKSAWRKKRWILKKMFGGDKNKTEIYCALRKKEGKWEPDKDFPDDEEEYKNWCDVDESLTRERVTEKSDE
eukprot:9469394-Alexandrium_andersonii.AAC.1